MSTNQYFVNNAIFFSFFIYFCHKFSTNIQISIDYNRLRKESLFLFCKCLMGGTNKLVYPCKKRQCEVRKELSGTSMIGSMRIYEIAQSSSQKANTDKQVCPSHPFTHRLPQIRYNQFISTSLIWLTPQLVEFVESFFSSTQRLCG